MSATLLDLPAVPVDMHYTVRVGGLTRRVELPFVTGVMADLSGHPAEPLPPVRERPLFEVDADRFVGFMAAIRPRLVLEIADAGSAELVFETLGDFEPDAIAARTGLAGPALDLIQRHPALLALEGSWRGLHRLVTHTEIDDRLSIQVLDISKRELGRTLRRFADRDQSPIFKRFYTEAYSVGRPFALLIGDYEFDHSRADVDLLREMAMIAAASFAPFIAAAAPAVMFMECWDELPNPRDLTRIFQTPDHAAWRSLRESEDARYLALALPRFDATGRAVWSNAAYLLAETIHRAFQIHGWCAHLCGLQTGGTVEDLTGGLEVTVDRRREGELSRLGLAGLAARPGSEMAEFVSAPTLHQPTRHDDPEEAAQARREAQLAHVLCHGRVVHHVSGMLHDGVLPSNDPAMAEALFNAWIADYRVDVLEAPAAFAVFRPLRGARFEIGEAHEDGLPPFRVSLALV